jgi:cleavage stimulation factor subunit 3
LWKYYLSYIRKRFSTDSSPESTQIVLKAFEAVIQNVGIDKDSGPMWSEYISFLKSIEPTSPHEEQQKLDQIRKAFHKAIVVPTANVEQLWKDYDYWENGLNRLTAKKYIADKSGVYMGARSNVRELRNLLEPLDVIQKTWLARPPNWSEDEITVVCFFFKAWLN